MPLFPSTPQDVASAGGAQQAADERRITRSERHQQEERDVRDRADAVVRAQGSRR